jgi:hypothetical protein
VILSPPQLSRKSLPPVHSLLFYRNFVVLDISLKSDIEEAADDSQTQRTSSYIDIGFGDDRKAFAGFHRFEVTREKGVPGEEKGTVVVCYSTMACNPTTIKAPATEFTYTFHMFYAWTLFRDGVAGILTR